MPSDLAERPLRILHVTMAFDAGGLSRYIFDLSSAMHAQGHQIAVAGDHGAWDWLYETAPFQLIHTPFNRGLKGLWQSIRILEQHLSQHPVDILHVHYRRCAYAARKVQRKFPVPILYTLHLSHISLNPLRRFFTDFGDHTHVASAEARQWLLNAAGVPAGKISTIPHGVDPARFHQPDKTQRVAARAALDLKPTDIAGIFVGRLDVPKNEDWLVDLATASRERLPNLKLFLVGEGPHEQALRDRIAREQLQDRVRLLGHRDPCPIYHAADALLLPSAREGFSLVCAEAMSAGVPVLRTRTSGTEELIVENVTGQSVPINHDLFLNAAMDFLSDADELKKMGYAAADHVRGNFTFDVQVNETIKLYRSLVAGAL
jgi:glycosyltransferase involved in cell wall biosynthesis